MTSYQLSPLAYLKLILHSAKYPSSRTIGLLIGRALPAESPSASINVELSDAIPLIHNWGDLSPITEAALQLVSIFAALVLI